MKIGVIGAGAVGAACIMSVIGRGAAHEIVVIDRDEGRATGLVTDMQYGMQLGLTARLVAGGYDDLAGAELLLVTAGINEKAGGAMDRNDPAGRLRLLGTNADIIRDVVSRTVAVVPDALILVVANPPEPLAELARRVAGHDRVLSAGTFLDTLRFRFHIAARLDVHPSVVQAQVIGEHGNSRVLLWSSAQVANTPLTELIPADEAASFRAQVEEQVRNANITIIEGIGASQYGVGMACARVAEAMMRDEHVVFPLGHHLPEYGVTLSMPVLIGRAGVLRVLRPPLSESEHAALDRSAETLRTAIAGL